MINLTLEMSVSLDYYGVDNYRKLA